MYAYDGDELKLQRHTQWNISLIFAVPDVGTLQVLRYSYNFILLAAQRCIVYNDYTHTECGAYANAQYHVGPV